MSLEHEQRADLLECLLDMGELLLECGAEISRVEDTLSRVGRAYGASHVDAFVITSLISLSIEFSDLDALTETRRIYSSAGTDFYRLEKINELSRSTCRELIPLPSLRKSLNDISKIKKDDRLIVLGSVLAAGSFAIFFGGSIWDGAVSSVFAVFVCLLQSYLGNTEVSTAASNLMISFLIGIGVGVLCKYATMLHMDKILIGDIMLLIPGLAMTNSVRNMLVGNTISGVVRLTECFVWALALAGGFMTAMLLLDILL